MSEKKGQSVHRVSFVPVFLAALIVLSGCVSSEAGPSGSAAPEQVSTAGREEEEGTVLTVTVGEKDYIAVLTESEAAKALLERLPLTVEMRELNGNEKYCYIEEALPTAPVQPVEIRAGDLMLYGDSCLVLFYEDFSSGYSYTRLGRLMDPADLAEAVGQGNVTVTLALAEMEEGEV